MTAGRKRAFDRQEALEVAMEVFWKNGYSGTSLSHLTEAMGINKPSLYAAFGNKEALFVCAVEQYVQDHGIVHFKKLENRKLSLQKRLKAYLESIAKMLCDTTLPGGCFVASSTCEAGSEWLPNQALELIFEINAKTKSMLVDFFKEELKLGNLPSSSKPEVLADYLLSIQYGLSVMAREGATKERLKPIIEYSVMHF